VQTKRRGENKRTYQKEINKKFLAAARNFLFTEYLFGCKDNHNEKTVYV
jgi:hypothetical protein